MPKIVVRDRADRSGPVKFTLGPIQREFPRNKEIQVSEDELAVLMNSHESHYVFVVPQEVNHGGIDRTERPDADPRGDEAGIRSGGKLR